MLDITIPKEIRGFEVKTFGPFTTRQMKCLVAAGILGFLTYYGERTLLGINNPPLIPIAIPAAPFLFLGWGEKFFHMKPEDYIRYVWIPNKKRNPNRKFVTDNYSPLIKQYKLEKKKLEKTKKEAAMEEDKKNKKKPEKVVIPKELQAELTAF